MIHFLLNALIFDLAWLITVVPAAQGLTWIGPLFSLCWLAFHCVFYPDRRLSDIYLCISAALLGYMADSLLVMTGLMTFPPQSQLGAPTTLWMVALWINLALTLNHSLIWLQHRYKLSAVAGAIAGPLAYFAGAKLNAISLEAGYLSLLAISIVWLICMPFLVWLAQTINRMEKQPHYTGALL